MSSPTITEEFEGFIKGITRPKLLPNIQTRTLQVNYGEDSFELDLLITVHLCMPSSWTAEIYLKSPCAGIIVGESTGMTHMVYATVSRRSRQNACPVDDQHVRHVSRSFSLNLGFPKSEEKTCLKTKPWRDLVQQTRFT